MFVCVLVQFKNHPVEIPITITIEIAQLDGAHHSGISDLDSLSYLYFLKIKH
jgi:hypothetical protein